MSDAARGAAAALRVLEWLGCDESEQIVARLDRYAAWLRDEAAPAGAIGPQEIDRLWERHLIDSLLFGVEPRDGERVLDLGAGAGLPGIPLALAFPSWTVELAERSMRRCDLLERVRAMMSLANVEVRRGDFAAITARYDRVVMRAVLPEAVAVEEIAGRLDPGGIGLLGLSATSAMDRPVAPGTSLVEIPPDILDVLDGGVSLLRIAPRGIG